MAAAERRAVVLLIDGLGDVALPPLGGRTPLQAARTPALDALAAAGATGLMDSVEAGRACGSDTAHLALFGYDPRAAYCGRGAFESLGAGCTLAAGDIAFKCNFACLATDAPGVVEARRVDRSFEVAGPRLCAALDGALRCCHCTPLCAAAATYLHMPNRCMFACGVHEVRTKESCVPMHGSQCTVSTAAGGGAGLEVPGHPGVAVQVRYATEHRCGVALHCAGGGLSDAVTDTDPLRDGLPLLRCQARDASPEVRRRSCDCLRVISLSKGAGAGSLRQARCYAGAMLLGAGSTCCDAVRFEHWHSGLTSMPSHNSYLELFVQADYTARVVNALSEAFQQVLQGHAANAERAAAGLRIADVVLLRGCGLRQALPTFQEKHGLRACIVAPTKVLGGAPCLGKCALHAHSVGKPHGRGLALPAACRACPPERLCFRHTVHARSHLQHRFCGFGILQVTTCLTRCCCQRAGLGMTLGMDWIPAPGATGSYDSDFDAKSAAIVEAVTAGGHQFGFVHVKAVDDCGHDRLWRHRVRYIERMDALVRRLARALLAAEAVLCPHVAHDLP